VEKYILWYIYNVSIVIYFINGKEKIQILTIYDGLLVLHLFDTLYEKHQKCPYIQKSNIFK